MFGNEGGERSSGALPYISVPTWPSLTMTSEGI